MSSDWADAQDDDRDWGKLEGAGWDDTQGLRDSG